MPRYSRKSPRTVVKAPKKSWNSGTIIAGYDIVTMNGVNNSACTTIVSNDNDNANPSPAVIKAKHIKVFGTICLQGNVTEHSNATPVQVLSYIMFVPQIMYFGIQQAASNVNSLYTTLNNMIIDHPEWVMSVKNVNVRFQGGIPGEQDVTKFTQTSGQMERNLRSGDKVCHIIMFKNLTATANYQRSLYFTYSYKSCYN